MQKKVLSLSHRSFNTQNETLKIVKNGRKFCQQLQEKVLKKLVGGFGNYCCVPGYKSASYDKYIFIYNS